MNNSPASASADEHEWLQALHDAFVSNISVLTNECDYPVNEPNMDHLVNLIRGVDQIPEVARERLIALLRGDDKLYEHKLVLKPNDRNRRNHSDLLAEVERSQAFEALRQAGVSSTYALGEVGDAMNCTRKRVQVAVTNMNRALKNADID